MANLYIDYCPRCPGENILDSEGRCIGHKFNPDKCRSCNPKTFTEHLGEYVNADADIKKLKREIEERQLGIDYYESKKAGYLQMFKDHCSVGGVRIVDLLGVTVVLDWKSSQKLQVLYAGSERNPDA